MTFGDVPVYRRGQVSDRFLSLYLRVHQRGDFSIRLLETLGCYLGKPRDGVNHPLDDPDQSREAVLKLTNLGRELGLLLDDKLHLPLHLLFVHFGKPFRRPARVGSGRGCSRR